MENQIVLSVDSLSKEFNKDGKPFMALNNLTFELKKGEILGVIGRNGAGKSTLLKILSRITTPTSGEISYEGKLTSIIDIGTGFHTDLSGEENVYLSALLLGYTKKEIKGVYDEIVSFAGLEDFMQMPVKHYSSGMYLRLAFSIAFHSKISILLLDEVIAVGDADFKRKCYSKIKELKARGTAIILVSHHLELIVSQCDRCILLDSGEIILKGIVLDVVNKYYELIESNEDVRISSSMQQATKDDEFSILKQFPIKIDQFQIDQIELLSLEMGSQLTTSTDIAIRFHCTKLIEDGSFEIALYLLNMSGVRVLIDSYGFRNSYEVITLPKGQYNVDVVIPGDLLSAGVYRLGLFLGVNREFVKEIDIIAKFKIFPEENLVEMRTIGSIVQPKLNWVINHLLN